MGRSLAECAPEVWTDVEPVFQQAQSTGIAVDVDEMELRSRRNNDFLEETVFQCSYIPLRGGSGKVEGIYNTVWEKTKQDVRRRRTEMLNRISRPSEIIDTDNVYQYIISQLESNGKDVPMAMFYQTTNASTSNNNSIAVTLVDSIGLPENHTYASTADLTSTQFPIPLLAAAREDTVDTDRGHYFNDVNWQGFGEPSHVISTIPLRNGKTNMGFLIIGTNP